MDRQCVLFTGPSGLNVRDALEKLADYRARQGGPRPAVVILDDRMVERHLQDYPDEPLPDMMRRPGGFQRLLLEPRRYLLNLWCNTVESTVSAIAPDEESVFLFLHSVFYHTSNRDFFSCVNLDHLKGCLSEKDLEINLVITLIDDVEDVWRRLKEPFQLFSSTNDVVQAMCDLLLLLYWRSMEILASARTAIDLDKPHFLISMKHPLSVVHDLIFSDKVPIYLAHPISEVQRLGSGDTTDRAKANRLKNEIQRLKDALADSAVVLPICPTGIDELVFKKDSTQQPLPELQPRWPYGDPMNLLFIPPDVNISEPFTLPGPKKLEAIGLLLRHLSDVVDDQINSRDRTLVEQTEVVLAWRPCYNGHASTGVDNEIRHRNKLIERGLCQAGEKQCFALGRWEDIGWYRIEAVHNLLESARAELPSGITPTSLRDRLTPLLDRLACPKGDLTWNDVARAVDPSRSINFPLPPIHTSTLGPRRSIAEEETHTANWSEIATKMNELFPQFKFLNTDVPDYDDSLTVGEFVHRVEEHLKPRRKRRVR